MVLFAFFCAVDIKKWWTWGYWISPIMYAQNAIVVNEFLGKSWADVSCLNALIGMVGSLLLCFVFFFVSRKP